MTFDLVLNESCNYNCFYCTVKNYKNTITKDKLDKLDWLFTILKKLHNKKLINVVIQGGDIGLVPEETLEYFFQKIYPIKVEISCQDNFFKNKYNEKFKDYYTVLYNHISDLDGCISPNIGVTGVVDKDPKKIKDFIDKYGPVNYIGFENDFSPITIQGIKETIKEFINIIGPNKQLQDILNISNEELKKRRKECYKAAYVTLSLCSGKIVQCIRNYNNSIELTNDNLYKYIIKPDIIKTVGCESCSRTFIDKQEHSKKINILMECR